MRRKILVFIAVLATAFLCFSGIVGAQTPTIADLQAQIAKLVAQLQAIQGQQNPTTQTWCHTFNNYLVAGSTDPEVSFLQTALKKSGFDVSADSQGVFGDDTAAAVVQFQAKYQIKQTGTIGPKTRTQLNALYGCAPGQTPALAPVQTPATVVTPQVAQTPSATLCNNVYYAQCPSGSSFVCPSSGAGYCQAQQNNIQIPQTQNQNQQLNNSQPPASCNGHMPTDANLPADCAAWNAQHMNSSPQQNGATPPPDCVGKTATTPNLPQDCQIYFGLMPQPFQPQPSNQQSLSPNCGGPGQVWCPSVGGGSGGWCQLPPCPSTTSQSGSSQTQPPPTTNSGSPYQNGMTPPPDCVGKTATTPNLPQDCQIYFGLITPASVLDAFNKLLQNLQSFVTQL